jgi:hypothetical protein
MASRAISQSDHARMSQDHLDNFLFDSNPAPVSETRVPWQMLDDIMSRFAPGTGAGYERGLKFHYGLNDQMELVLAFSPLVLIPEPGDPDLCRVFEGAHHEIYDTGSGMGVREVADWRGTWAGDEESLGGRYEALTSVDRNGQGHAPLEHDDPRSCIVPWDDELVLLFDQNRNTGEPPSEFELVITHVAESFNPSGFKHMLAFHMSHTSGDRLDDNNADPGRPYHYQAADMVNACPTECHLLRKR